MNYCHECGSEIAEIDTFCPFCGISLKPAFVSDSVPDEQDKTIAVNQSDLQDILLQPDSSQVEKTEDSFLPEENSIVSENLPPEISAVTEQRTEIENAGFESESESSDNVEFIEKEVEFKDENILEDSVQQKFEQLEDESVLKDATLVDVPRPQVLGEIIETRADASTAEPTTENQIPESGLVEIEETDVSDISSTDLNVETESENPVKEDNSENLVKDEEVVQTIQPIEDEELSKEESGIDISESQDSNAPRSGTVIEKPEIPVEENENRDTTFDSVKIMDDGKKETVEDQPEILSTTNVKPDSEIKPDVEPAVEKEKEYTNTTPNFGAGDTDGRKSPKLKPLDEGTVLNGRYEIVRKIGGGGMGAVYLATDRNLGGILRAVKEMIQSYIEETQQDKAISDFKRESMLLTSLDHSSIPTIYDYFYDEKEGRFYLVMKYISGGDLASRLRSSPEGRIDEETVVGWAAQIADVLDYLHNRQPPIVYRDLKPANIMIDSNTERTMLIDFGIARWINKEEKGVTAVGTMGYAPPELFSGKVEPSSDIYSLGSTMFHLLTGADPQSNPLLIFDFQKHPRPRQINPQLSDQIEKILLKMVEYSAEKRYKTAGEVRDALNQHLESLKTGKATFGISKAPSAVSFSEQTVFCGFCGQKIVATDMFCAFCGSKQPLAQQGVHSAEYHLPQTTAKLFVIGTNELEVPTYVIEKDDNLLGRRDPLSNIFPEVDLSKYDPQTKISRRHAHIWRSGDEFLLEDLGSSNGTLVLRIVGDAVRLNPHQPHTLVNGEKIKVGDTTLHFVIG